MLPTAPYGQSKSGKDFTFEVRRGISNGSISADLSIKNVVTKFFKNAAQILNKSESPYSFRFSEKSTIVTSTGHPVDVSNIELDLSDIFVGGIGWGGAAIKLLARAMRDIGQKGNVSNLPFAIDALITPDYCDIGVYSTEDMAVKESTIQHIISNHLENNLNVINIPLSLNGHASLASINIIGNTAILKFYDSLSPDSISYEKRYNAKLVDFIKTLLPDSISLKGDTPEVLHLLDQGGADSKGCGYYTIYTALLLTNDPDIKELKTLDAPILDQHDDIKIRADLIIRTLIAFGIENIAKTGKSERNRFDGIFSRVPSELDRLIDQLRPRLYGLTQITENLKNPYFFRFPEKSTITMGTGQLIDISNIELDLSEIFMTGIGPTDSIKLLARTMRDIGQKGHVSNLPFAIDAFIMPDYCEIGVRSTEDALVQVPIVQQIISKHIENNFHIINIPMLFNEHASLVSINISEGTSATLKFYDSKPPNATAYEKRYTETIVGFIKSLLPDSINLTSDAPEVFHLLDQGEARSGASNYYTLYTALLLTNDEAIKDLTPLDTPILDQRDDIKIRADLIIRTLIAFGIENVAKIHKLERNRSDGVFARVPSQLDKLINQLRPRLS